MSRLKPLKLSLNKRGLVARYDEEIQKLLGNRSAERVPVNEVQAAQNVWYLPRPHVDNHSAERVPVNEVQAAQTAWYLPRPHVISEKKPDTLRVVSDCAAKFHGKSLNDKCYRGADLTNKYLLLNVLGAIHNYQWFKISICYRNCSDPPTYPKFRF